MRGEYSKERPDGGWGWMIVLGGLYDLSMWAGFLRCLSVFFNPLMTEFDVEYGAVSRLTGLFQIGYGVFTSLCPLALKHFEARSVCMAASIIAGISCFVASFATKLWVVQTFMGFVVGGATGFLLNSQFTMVARYFKRKHHAANQIMCMGISFGPFIVCPGFQYLISTYGWRGAAQIASAILLNTAVASALMRPIKLESDLGIQLEKSEKSSPEKECTDVKGGNDNKKPIDVSGTNQIVKTDQNCDNESAGLIAVDAETGNSSPNLSSNNIEDGSQNTNHRSGYIRWIADKLIAYNINLFIDPIFYEFTMSWTGFSITFYSVLAYMIPYGEKVLGLDNFKASTLISAVACGELFSRVVYTFVLDRISQRRRVIWMATVFGLTGVVSLLFTFSNGYVGAMIISVIIGILGGGIEAFINTIIAEIFELHQYAAALGYSNLTYSVIDSIAVMLIGATVDHFGDMKLPFYIGCVTSIISCLITVKLIRSMDRIRRDRRAKQIHD
ncbi:monocarboxylate transporter 12-like [Styela clava]